MKKYVWISQWSNHWFHFRYIIYKWKKISKNAHHVNCILFFHNIFLIKNSELFLKEKYFMLDLCTCVQNNDLYVIFFKWKELFEINMLLLSNYLVNLKIKKKIQRKYFPNRLIGPLFWPHVGPLSLAFTSYRRMFDLIPWFFRSPIIS